MCGVTRDGAGRTGTPPLRGAALSWTPPPLATAGYIQGGATTASGVARSVSLLRLGSPTRPCRTDPVSSTARDSGISGRSPVITTWLSSGWCATMPEVPAVGVVLTDRLELRPWSPSDELSHLLADERVMKFFRAGTPMTGNDAAAWCADQSRVGQAIPKHPLKIQHVLTSYQTPATSEND